MANSPRKKSSGSANNRASKQLMLVLVAFVCGYLSGSLLDVNHLSEWVKQRVFAQKPDSPLPKPAHQAAMPKPKFEFYTLLTSEHAHVSNAHAPEAKKHSDKALKSDTNPKMPASVAEAVPVANKDKDKKNTYLLQVASFKQKEDAERFKASLILKGFDVQVTLVKQQQTRWFRVILGPYPSKIQAEKVQNEIARTEHTMGVIRKMQA